MNTLPLVSIIVPTYNRARYVREAIESVGRQDYPGPIELIVVDDGSTDDTSQVIQSCVREFPRLQIVEIRLDRLPRTPSAAPARNAGLHKASGELIGFLDSDDLFDPTKLRLQVEALQAHPEANLCTCVWEWFWELPAKHTRVRGGESIQSGPLLPGYMSREGWYFTHSALYRRDILQAAGEWDKDSTWGDDTIFHMKVGLAGAVNIHLPGLLCSVRMHGGDSFQNSKEKHQRAEAEAVLFQCHDRIAELLRLQPAYYQVCREYLVHWYMVDVYRYIQAGFYDLARLALRRARENEPLIFRRLRLQVVACRMRLKRWRGQLLNALGNFSERQAE